MKLLNTWNPMLDLNVIQFSFSEAFDRESVVNAQDQLSMSQKE